MNKFFLLGLLITIFNINSINSSEIKIIFKIEDKAFTSLDYELRVKYLDFIGDNENLNKDIIVEDYISANLFYHHFQTLNNVNNFEVKINEIYKNIEKINKENKKVYNYEIEKENILFNIKLDFIRKTILENILKSNKDIKKSNSEIDLLYSFKIEYVNFEYEKINEIKEIFKNLDKINLTQIIKILEKRNINYFIKVKEINDIHSINKIIKKNILENKNIFIIENGNNISIVLIKKSFQTLEGLIANIFSVRSNDEIDKNFLKCNNLINNLNNLNINSKDYKFSDLNNELKEKLININDYTIFEDNNQKIYIVLCDIKFNKEILNNYNLNKIINSNVSRIEKNFVDKYSRIYNLKKMND